MPRICCLIDDFFTLSLLNLPALFPVLSAAPLLPALSLNDGPVTPMPACGARRLASPLLPGFVADTIVFQPTDTTSAAHCRQHMGGHQQGSERNVVRCAAAYTSPPDFLLSRDRFRFLDSKKGVLLLTRFFGVQEFFGYFCQNFGIRGAEHHKRATLTQPSPTSCPVIQ